MRALRLAEPPSSISLWCIKREYVEKIDAFVTEFSPSKFGVLVEKITVYSKTDIRVMFMDGTVI